METRVAAKLEEANKLIFVKRYDEAEKALDEILSMEHGKGELAIHLRRIELASMLRKVDKLHAYYLSKLHKSAKSKENYLFEYCIAMVEQHGDLCTPAESILAYQDILKRHGAHAAGYYGIGLAMEAQENLERALYNYEQAVATDPSWHLANFGLSQVYYHLGDNKRGDHYFFLFEQAAPYNVYGNFETHRKLCQEFLDHGRFSEAEAAIQALSAWWVENKGQCPLEIQIYELLATAKVAAARGDKQQAENRKVRASGLAQIVLDDPKTSEGVLYFIAKVLEEFDDFSSAFNYYKKILRGENSNPTLVQKIGSQFLAMGEFKLAKDLFSEAYEIHPEHPDIRFCLLVSNLKLAGVNVEEYLIGRERLRQLIDGGDKVELLALLHSLVAKFPGDADVQGHMADIYMRLGNIDRAAKNFQTMFDLDGRNRATALKYAAFIMQYRDPMIAKAVLDKIPTEGNLSTEDQAEIFWLNANYYARQKDFRKSNEFLRRVLAIDPWNVSYLVQEVINLHNLCNLEEDLRRIDPVLGMLNGSDESKLDWREFDQITKRLQQQSAMELVYARCKLRYLYANGAEGALLDLVHSACRHDAARGTYDFVRLLNTNFDSPYIYWALGIMFKELWQLETASVWFEQMLLYPGLLVSERARAYLELADCYVWQGKNQQKAVEYAKLGVEMDERKDVRSTRILAHALLKAGQIRQAKVYLEQMQAESDLEVRYLNGLMHYRNGARNQANEVWKPLLTVRSESLRFHNIKQDVLRYYFDGEPYLKAN